MILSRPCALEVRLRTAEASIASTAAVARVRSATGRSVALVYANVKTSAKLLPLALQALDFAPAKRSPVRRWTETSPCLRRALRRFGALDKMLQPEIMQASRSKRGGYGERFSQERRVDEALV